MRFDDKSSKFKLNLQRWYKVLYIPGIKGIIILGKCDLNKN